MPAGLADPSARPSRPRSPASVCQLWARPCAMLMSDQASGEDREAELQAETSSM